MSSNSNVQDPAFVFRVMSPIPELGAKPGQDLIYRPLNEVSRIQLVTHLPDLGEGVYEDLILRHYHRLRLTGQCPPVSAISALEFLKKAAQLRDSA